MIISHILLSLHIKKAACVQGNYIWHRICCDTADSAIAYFSILHTFLCIEGLYYTILICLES